ncbi:UNKNOWN [Stylonychia lemnae]|uniref:Uncharacterized protein n=1 Tax=Stylonychia lemnae TaxID=5949 RepID=A0A078ASE0_STYLE|nr:UNKNOWN [Stylonychia lemnae]|eukprot:CDW84137.1 UNKNOWN [Stylonychia lemnae]
MVFGFIRHIFANNKKVLFMIAVYVLTILIYRDLKRQKREKKILNKKLQLIRKIKVILQELMVEANFSLNVAFLKYKDKQLKNSEQKKQQQIEEFKGELLEYWLNKRGVQNYDFEQIVQDQNELKSIYESIMKQFESYKDRKPEQIDIYISKFNTASMKTIYKKYLGYLRYLTYHHTKDTYDYTKRFTIHYDILTNEAHLKEIFALYVMSFDHMNPSFQKDIEGAYFREFKKGYYQLMFEKSWIEDIFEIESQHLQSLSMILRFSHKIKNITNDSYMSENTIELKNQDYGVRYDLPVEIGQIISQQTKDYIKNHYILMMSSVLSQSPKQICYMQAFNINSNLNKLRIIRDRINLNGNESKLNNSQNSFDTIGGHSASAKSNTHRAKRNSNFVPLVDKLKVGISQSYQQQIQGMQQQQFHQQHSPIKSSPGGNASSNEKSTSQFNLQLENTSLIQSENFQSLMSSFKNQIKTKQEQSLLREPEIEEQKQSQL